MDTTINDDVTPPRPSVSPCSVALLSTLDLNRSGGLETYVRSLTDGLAAVGHDVTWNGDPAALPYHFDTRWSRLSERLLSLMTRARFRWISRAIAESFGEKQCRKWLRDVSVMHYVGTGWNLLGFPATRVARQRGLVKTCWPAIHPDQWGDSDLDFDLYRTMDAIFVQSDFEKQYFEDRGIEASQLVRCDLAPPPLAGGNANAFIDRHQLGGRQRVLFLGRKCPLKGYHVLRQAVGALAAQGRPITLISIGASSGAAVPELPPEVDLDLGRADDCDKADALAACDVMALPSVVESFGIAYTEAWSYAKPVICGPSPASRELVMRHEGGLVADQDPDDLVDQLARLLDDTALQARLGAGGRKAVETQLCWSRVVDVHVRTWGRLGQRTDRIRPTKLAAVS